MKFSVVIPVYNVEKYLDQCVESVISQTFRDFELILVDDGSPDGSGAMCDRWAEKDCRVRVVHQANGGLSAARNTGIRQAEGTYILFLDSDDWWAENTVLEKIAAVIDRTVADVVSFNYRKSFGGSLEPMYFSESVPSSETAMPLDEGGLLETWVTGACNKAIRRELLTEHRILFRTGITSEDIDWTLRLALYADRFAFANVCVFVYRQHASSISHSMSARKVECLCGNVQECVRLLDAAVPEKAEMLKPFVAYQYGTLLYNIALLPASGRSKELMKAAKEMRWLLRCSDNGKVWLLRMCDRCLGLSLTFAMLRLRQKLLERGGKGV